MFCVESVVKMMQKFLFQNLVLKNIGWIHPDPEKHNVFITESGIFFRMFCC